MKNPLRLLHSFLFKTKRRGLTLKTVWLVGVARFRIYFFKSSKLQKYMGTPGETPFAEITDNTARLNMFFVADRVKRVAKRMPWQSKCLAQAMTAQRLLKGYGLKSTLYLGVGKDPDDASKMVAHAWVRCGTVYICGGNGEQYAVVSRFVM